MTEIIPKELFEGLDFNGLKAIRAEANRRIQLERNKKTLRVTTYIPAGVRDDFDAAVKWAHEHKIIEKPSKWMFCQMATRNAVLYITEQIKAEELTKARTTTAISSQMASGAQSQGQDTTRPPKLA